VQCVSHCCGLLEKQRRFQKRLEELGKGRKTALDFTAEFEAACDDLNECGLGKGARELLLC